VHKHVIVNRRLVEASRARLPAAGAALHGRGVFTTLAVYGGRPFLWDEHWTRLVNHARRAGVACPFGEAETARSLGRLVEANGVERGRARVTVLARGARGLWTAPGVEGEDSDLVIMTGDARRREEETLALTVSPFRTNTCSPLAGLKTVNYLEHILAWEEARARDFDEAVVLNERGEVASGSMSNIFWVKHGTVHTPALAAGALAGTTRSRVMELAEGMAVPLVEGVQNLHDLADAEEIFLTSATLGVALVTSFDFHRYTVPVGSVALRLHEAFRQLTLGGGKDF
jgi:branched-subunit amino acid aminotransferase/4-amino-4-deoxychorismate lyase